MGLGKTLICLAVILATQGHVSSYFPIVVSHCGSMCVVIYPLRILDLQIMPLCVLSRLIRQMLTENHEVAWNPSTIPCPPACLTPKATKYWLADGNGSYRSQSIFNSMES